MPIKPPDRSPRQTRDVSDPPNVISDAKAMRALAHPVRLALLDAMRTEGEITATQAAEILDDSPGNMSWHLQTLAKYGFIEEAGGGKGRSRPWRIASSSNRFSPAEGDPGSHAAGRALQMTVMERTYELMREWWAVEQTFDPEWREASFMTDAIIYLTPEELSTLGEQIAQLSYQFSERLDKAQRPEGTVPVHLTAHGHPMPGRTPGT
jgi:DNA-binding transcriptional ArsR family regulator